jgi:hypothetical protein
MPQAFNAAWISAVWAELPKKPAPREPLGRGPVNEPEGRVKPPDGRVKEPDGRVNDPDGRVNDPDGRAGKVIPAALRQVVTAGLLNKAAAPPAPRAPAPAEFAADEADVGAAAALVFVEVEEPPPQAASTPAAARTIAMAPAVRVELFIRDLSRMDECRLLLSIGRPRLCLLAGHGYVYWPATAMSIGRPRR